MKNTDLQVQIPLSKYYTEIMKKAVLENMLKIAMPLFGAAYAILRECSGPVVECSTRV